MTPPAQPLVLLGLAGYAQSGKDTAARALTDAGWTRMAFGDGIRDFALAINPWVKIRVERSGWWGRFRRFQTVRLADLVAQVGWDAAKAHPEVRKVLQDVGAAARDAFGPDAWTDAVLRVVRRSDESVVIADVRFPAEVAAIRAAAGHLVRITRPGTGPVNAHPSETALDDVPVDATFENATTPDELGRAVLRYVTS